MWGQPKRNTKNACCSSRGRCSCQRRNNVVVARRPEAAPRSCPKKHGPTVCGKTVRDGVCPCPDC